MKRAKRPFYLLLLAAITFLALAVPKANAADPTITIAIAKSTVIETLELKDQSIEFSQKNSSFPRKQTTTTFVDVTSGFAEAREELYSSYINLLTKHEKIQTWSFTPGGTPTVTSYAHSEHPVQGTNAPSLDQNLTNACLTFPSTNINDAEIASYQKMDLSVDQGYPYIEFESTGQSPDPRFRSRQVAQLYSVTLSGGDTGRVYAVRVKCKLYPKYTNPANSDWSTSNLTDITLSWPDRMMHEYAPGGSWYYANPDGSVSTILPTSGTKYWTEQVDPMTVSPVVTEQSRDYEVTLYARGNGTAYFTVVFDKVHEYVYGIGYQLNPFDFHVGFTTVGTTLMDSSFQIEDGEYTGVAKREPKDTIFDGTIEIGTPNLGTNTYPWILIGVDQAKLGIQNTATNGTSGLSLYDSTGTEKAWLRRDESTGVTSIGNTASANAITVSPTTGNIGIGTTPSASYRLYSVGGGILSENTGNSFVANKAGAGGHYWDSQGVGIPAYFRVSNASVVDTTAMTLFSNGNMQAGGSVQIGGSSGPILKNNSGTLEARNSSDNGYVPIKGSAIDVLGIYGSYEYIGIGSGGTATLSVSSVGTYLVSSTGQTVTLPSAVGISGRKFTIKLTATGSCTINTDSSQTIDGATTYSLAARWNFVTVQSDGANWVIIAKG